MPGPLGYFKLYHRDWLASSGTREMSLAERGAFIDLLCFQWEDGFIVDDPDRLAKRLGVSTREMRRIWPALRPHFEEIQPGRLANPRLEQERASVPPGVDRDALRERWRAGRTVRRERMLQAGGLAIPVEVRERVLIRDCYTCQGCGAREGLTIDHKAPISRGGTHDEENLQVLCRPCNASKKALLPSEWEGRR